MAIKFGTTGQPDKAKPKSRPQANAVKLDPVASPVERGRGRPPSGKELVTMRLDGDLLAYYRAKGKGWQSALNNDLKELRKRRGSLPPP